jgi:hypothetical protein
MKTRHIFPIFLLLLQTACNNEEKATTDSENNVDAARNFIRAALDGKFNEARDFMIQDSLNNNYLDVAERSFNNLSQDKKDNYRGSSIRFHQPIVNLNDSTSVIIYSNSFMNDPDTLQVRKTNGKWLVDLKYLYQHDTDSTSKRPTGLHTNKETDTLK